MHRWLLTYPATPRILKLHRPQQMVTSLWLLMPCVHLEFPCISYIVAYCATPCLCLGCFTTVRRCQQHSRLSNLIPVPPHNRGSPALSDKACDAPFPPGEFGSVRRQRSTLQSKIRRYVLGHIAKRGFLAGRANRSESQGGV